MDDTTTEGEGKQHHEYHLTEEQEDRELRNTNEQLLAWREEETNVLKARTSAQALRILFRDAANLLGAITSAYRIYDDEVSRREERGDEAMKQADRQQEADERQCPICRPTSRAGMRFSIAARSGSPRTS